MLLKKLDPKVNSTINKNRVARCTSEATNLQNSLYNLSGSQWSSIAIAQELSVNVIELNLGLEKTKCSKCLPPLIVSQHWTDIFTNLIHSIVTELWIYFVCSTMICSTIDGTDCAGPCHFLIKKNPKPQKVSNQWVITFPVKYLLCFHTSYLMFIIPFISILNTVW